MSEHEGNGGTRRKRTRTLTRRSALTTLKEKQEKAVTLLDAFSEFTEYKHGARNPYLSWLGSLSTLDPESVVRFLCFWYPVSRHQPQILLHCAAAHPDRADRESIMRNYWEEDGLVNPGDDPHYDLLEKLIRKLGGRIAPDAEAEALIGRFHDTLNRMTPAQASGVIAAVEHPALDISGYLHQMIGLCGASDLLRSDPYLTIHVRVEPDHIIWSHGTALRYLERGKEEVVHAFQRVMSFWEEYWSLAFSRLNCPLSNAA